MRVTVCINPLQVQTKLYINDGQWIISKFQSPIGTNKTYRFECTRNEEGGFNPLQVQTKHGRNRNAVEKNFFFNPLQVQTKHSINYHVDLPSISFQSPIGTNKTGSLWQHQKQPQVVSIPYRYKQNDINAFDYVPSEYGFNPLQVQTKRGL